MTDSGFRGILKGASVVGAGMVFSKGITLLAEITVAKELGSTDFGGAIFAYTVLLTLSGVALIGIPEGLTYYLSILDERDNTDAAFRTVVSGLTALTLALSIIVIFIYIVPNRIVKMFGVSNTQWRWVELLAPLVVAYATTQTSFGVMRAYDRSVPKVLSDDVLNKLIAFAALVIAIWQNLEMAVFLSFYLGQYLLSGTLAGGYVIHLLRQKLTFSAKLDGLKTDAHRLISYSWPLAFKNATRRLLGNTDIILVGALLTSSSVGYYRVGYTISQLGMITLISISYLFTPRTARRYDNNDREGMKRLYRKAARWSTLLALPVLLTMIYYPNELIKLFFGTEYVPGSIVLVILAIGIILRSGMGTAAAVLRAINRTRVDFVVTVVMSVLNLGLSYVLIQRFGIVGAAVGTFLAIFLMNAIQIILVYRFVSIQPFSRRYLGGLTFLIGISILVNLLINKYITNQIIIYINVNIEIILFIIIFTSVEGVVAWLGGLLTRSEKEAILGILDDVMSDLN